ncbi:DUF2225 domain-containing protein [Lentzea nigeriaca]|uniref:DUF2225 domain-containing protein n=1 Tax=Lentzea nigeriaca TaxID=1128665 RepID=UPI00195E25B6|nr:DUF2225 domain-containing protein [Lentzea nigeriaca]MBM7861585.1 uncharacterized protein (DUF2225 family) [Lentzea nigeriaca]
MTTHHPLKLQCPNCGNNFTVDALTSYTRMGTDTDFRPRTAGADILEYLIHTCASCGFSGHDTHFSGEISREAARLINERLTPLVRDERSTASRRYEYAAWIAEWRRQGDRAVADYYLRASWCCRESFGEVRDDQGTYYRNKAIEHFERAIDNDECGDNTIAIIYLIGELHRRSGAFDEARSWFVKAETLARSNEGQKWVADIAMRQAELAARGIAGGTDTES